MISLRDLLYFEPCSFDITDEDVKLSFELKEGVTLHNILHALAKYKTLAEPYSNPLFSLSFTDPIKQVMTNNYNQFRGDILSFGNSIRAGEVKTIGIGDWQEKYYSVLVLISQEESYIRLKKPNEKVVDYLLPFAEAILKDGTITVYS